MPPIAKVQFTLYEMPTKRQVWRTATSFGEGEGVVPLSRALMTALQTLGMKTTARPAVRIDIPGVPVNKGDTVASVRSTLGTTVETQPEKSLMPNKRSSSITLADRGVQVFFDNDDKLERVKLFQPYAQAIQGVKIGDSRAAVLATLGEPTNEEFITRPYMVYRAGSNRVSFQVGNKGQVESIWLSQ
ncbi:hypothetical protein ACQ86G_19270 [Roseateles chitinivorans]|uniref:hypothetical protein n=1 Tax=Roseateles chitinivorans TaxID=2917965 RepID=UPI003D6778CB